MKKEFFIKQLDKLVLEYSDKGFTMTREKAEQWYGFMENITEATFEKCINECLKTQKFPPVMADILSLADKFYNPYKEID